MNFSMTKYKLPLTISGATILLVGICTLVFLKVQNQEEVIVYCPESATPIIIAEPNWDSAQLNTSIISRIIEEGFGCKTEVIPGGTTTITDGLIDGRFDIIAEMWVNTAPEKYSDAKEQGVIRELGNVFTSEEGWYVPRYLVESPDSPAYGLTHVDQLPEYADVFTTENELGIFHNCTETWFCKKINDQKFQEYNLEDHFINKSHSSAGGLDSSIAGAFQNKEPWLGYYWSPTKITATYDLIKLKEEPFSDTCWDTDRACAYPASQIMLAGHGESLDSYHPAIVSFLEQYRTDTETLQKYLTFDDFSYASNLYLEQNQNVWTKWLPEDVSRNLTPE